MVSQGQGLPWVGLPRLPRAGGWSNCGIVCCLSIILVILILIVIYGD
jgi:hypothetical protein